jgi:AAA+ superfamily predicted ATPase
MRTVVSSDKLRTLFQAYQDKNDAAFIRAAENIIAEEIAANHHVAATEMQRALGQRRDTMSSTSKPSELTTLPKDRRNGEDLLSLHESRITAEKVTLSNATKARLQRILEEHRNRLRLRQHGYAPKAKLLFWGPPGTGKTLSAHYLAHELGLPIGVLRLNSVISSFLGDTAAHLQRVFTRANNTPMVLLLDEVDAIGKNRDDDNDVGELKRVVNSLLQAMDSFDGGNSILIAASNHQYLLDPALWRRFDDVVSFPLPGYPEREEFLRYLLNGVKVEGSLTSIARQMDKLAYADIERIATEAVKTMILEGKETVAINDISSELRTWRTSVDAAKRKNGTRKK